MKDSDILFKSLNSKNVKLLYESMKQDFIDFKNIKSKFNTIIKKNNIINSKFLINIKKLKFNKVLKNNNNNLNKSNSNTMKNLEKIIHDKFIKIYQTKENFYNIKIINEIINNENSRIVSKFKEFLIKDDLNEFISRFYKKNKSISILKEIFHYYKIYSCVYPNYILLTEKKYIYNNIKKKQKIIDLQEQEEQKNYRKNKIKLTNKNFHNEEQIVFDSKIIDSILNQSNSSNLNNRVFGISNESSNDFDIKNINDIIEKINLVEGGNGCFKYIEKEKEEEKEKDNIYNKNNSNNNKIMFNKKKINNEHLNINKTKTYYNSDFKSGKIRFYLNELNKESLNKNKDEKNNAINGKKEINNDYEPNEKNAVSLNNISKEKKSKKCSRNFKYNITEESSKLNIVSNFLKTENAISKSLINQKRTIQNKIPNLIENKETNKTKKSKVTFLNTIIFPNIQSKYTIEKKRNNNNNRQIKKAVIDELLSSLSSAKETWGNSKLTESHRELSNRSVNITDKVKLPVNINKEPENIRSINISDNFESISKIINSDKNKKQHVSDKELMNNKREKINKNSYHNSLGKKTKKVSYKKNNLNVIVKNDVNKKKVITSKSKKRHCRYFSKQFHNTEINNIISKEKNNSSKKDKKIIPKNKISYKESNTNSIINTQKTINYNLLSNKNGRNKKIYLNEKINTLSLNKGNKYVNTNNSINNNNSNIDYIKLYETVSSISECKEKNKLISIKNIKFKNTKEEPNNYKKLLLKKINLYSERNINSIHLRRNKKNLPMNYNQKKIELFPLSARISYIINDESSNLTKSLNFKRKPKYKNGKYSSNNMNPVKKGKKNNFLTSSTIKNEDEKIKKMKTNIISNLNMRQNKRKSIFSSNILSASYYISSDMNSLYTNTLNSTINKFDNSTYKKNNYRIYNNYNIKKRNLFKNYKTRNNLKKYNINYANIIDKSNKNKYYGKSQNINGFQKMKNNKEKNINNKINDNNAKFIKNNSILLSNEGLSKVNDISYYYSFNINNNTNKSIKYKSKFVLENKNNKKAKNMKSIMNKRKEFENCNFKEMIVRKNTNFFPISATERNIQNSYFK